MIDLRERNYRDMHFILEWKIENEQHPEWADADWYLDDMELDNLELETE